MGDIGTIEQLTRARLEREVADAAYRAAGESTGLTLAGFPCNIRLRYNPLAFVDPCNHPLVEGHVILTQRRLAYPDVTIRSRTMGHAAVGLREEGLKGLGDPNALREFACMTAEFAGRDLATVPIPEIEEAIKVARANWHQIDPLAMMVIADFRIPDLVGDHVEDLDLDEDSPSP